MRFLFKIPQHAVTHADVMQTPLPLEKIGNLNHKVTLACCHACLSECQLRIVSFALRNKLQMPHRDESRNQGCWLLAYIVIYGSNLIHCGLFCGRAFLK